MSQLTAPLDAILGSTSKVRLLRLLISDHQTASAREAARLTRMSAPAILQAAEELVALGLAVREESGHQVRLTANKDHALFALLHGLFAAEASWAAILFGAIRESLVPGRTETPGSWSPSLASGPVVAAGVFGSTARGEDQPGSDLDLLVLVRTPDDADLIRSRIAEQAPRWRARFGITVSAVVMGFDRARRRHAAGDTLLAQAARDARMIVGAPLGEILTRGPSRAQGGKRGA